MKICIICKQEKSFDCFDKSGKYKSGLTKYQSRCKECSKIYRKIHYEKYKQYYVKKANKHNFKMRAERLAYLQAYAKDGCIICGEKDFACIQFDHKNPDEKEFNISVGMCSLYPFDKIKNELKKCDILCANCHAKKTAKQFNWYNYNNK